MVTFPPCLVTFPRCLIPKTCASHGCTLISLKCLISGDIAMQHVEKHFIAVEVNAAHFFPILVKRSIRRFTLIRTLYNNNSWSLASLYCSFTNHFSSCWDLWVFCANKSHANFQQTSTSTSLPKR